VIIVTPSGAIVMFVHP